MAKILFGFNEINVIFESANQFRSAAPSTVDLKLCVRICSPNSMRRSMHW